MDSDLTRIHDAGRMSHAVDSDGFRSRKCHTMDSDGFRSRKCHTMDLDLTRIHDYVID
jgi:hypothetical protein